MEIEALKDEIGISPESVYRHTFESNEMGFGDDWRGYCVEVLGQSLGRFSDLMFSQEALEVASRALGYTTDVLKANPRLLLPFTCMNVPGDPDAIVKILSLRARYKNSPLFAEMRFSPFGALPTTIRAESNRVAQTDYDKAQKALELLGVAVEKVRQSPGRPRELEGVTALEISTTYAWLWFLSQHGENERKFPAPTQARVAEEYKVHRTRLHDYIKNNLHESWSNIKKEGIRIGKSLTSDQVPPFIKARF